VRDTADIRLTDFGFEAGPPSWSHDGTRIAFVSFDRKGRPGISLLWLVTLDTASGHSTHAAKVPLPASMSSVSWVAWSPVGDELAIEANGSKEGEHTLWRMRPDGTRALKLLEFTQHTYGGVAWTPDGKTLLYSALVADGPFDQLFSIPAMGGQPRQLTRESGHVLHPAVSPNGKWIAATKIKRKVTLVSIPVP